MDICKYVYKIFFLLKQLPSISEDLSISYQCNLTWNRCWTVGGWDDFISVDSQISFQTKNQKQRQMWLTAHCLPDSMLFVTMPDNLSHPFVYSLREQTLPRARSILPWWTHLVYVDGKFCSRKPRILRIVIILPEATLPKWSHLEYPSEKPI